MSTDKKRLEYKINDLNLEIERKKENGKDLKSQIDRI